VEYRQLGRSGLRVSTLALGAATFGGRGALSVWGDTDTHGAIRLIDASLDAGVNMIDTANIYSNGVSEQIVGKALVGGRRQRILVATKARLPMGRGPNDRGSSRHHLIASCEASLRRLRTDHIDLYQLHHWDGETPLEETLEALDTLVRSGKVRYVGCSNFTGWQVVKAVMTSQRLGYQQFVSHQVYFSLQSREAEWDMIPAGIDQGLGAIVWSPLAGGLLSGAYRRGVQPDVPSRHVTGWKEPPIRDWESLYDTIDVLVEIADDHRVSAAQVALVWLMARPGITSLVFGARHEKQLHDNLAAADLQLTADEHQRLEQVSRVPLPYPHWHAAMAATDRMSLADRSLHEPELQASFDEPVELAEASDSRALRQ
jgi:aryl-alcohol dehydrogenase-like predicted oxidoreductase